MTGELTDSRRLGRSLKKLAAEPALATRQAELEHLAEAVSDQDGNRLDRWAEVDLLHTFVRPESVAATTRSPEEHRGWAWLEAGLGAFVFLPLVLSWYGLTQASRAYQELVAERPAAAARPFLQLWQTGFEGHLSGVHTFGSVALGATAVIVVLLALALVHGARGAAVDRREERGRRATEEVLGRLTVTLSRTQLYLGEHRRTSPLRFAAELTESAATLRRLGQDAVRVQTELGTAAASVETAVRGAETALSAVDTSVRPLERAAGQIEKAVRESGDGIGGALGEVRGGQKELHEGIGAAAERVEDSAGALAAAQQSFTTGIEVSADVTARLLSRLDSYAERSAAADEAAGAALRQLAEQTAALRRTADRFAELTEALQEYAPGPPPEPAGPEPAKREPAKKAPAALPAGAPGDAR
ncbi:hypothetical protein [Streptomyces albidoflavus]|uniref:hypothetical protein n=1 Tax=Streptomyces albidoflavus TaxID=1886 RepID=UPI00101E34C5|nr:hypothetical protein [Streptomyces albidoflavus]RZD87489.1 hypothetical protein C0Q63_10800 [Streptomyces albidoflavus]